MDADRPFSGFKEAPHKADMALDVFAPNLPDLFINAALGLYHILGIRKGTGGLENLHISLDDLDQEGLLVSFLNELLYYVERNQVGDEFQLEITDFHLNAIVRMGTISSRQEEIKAVTYHELKIRKMNNYYQTRIVLDL